MMRMTTSQIAAVRCCGVRRRPRPRACGSGRCSIQRPWATRSPGWGPRRVSAPRALRYARIPAWCTRLLLAARPCGCRRQARRRVHVRGDKFRHHRLAVRSRHGQPPLWHPPLYPLEPPRQRSWFNFGRSGDDEASSSADRSAVASRAERTPLFAGGGRSDGGGGATAAGAGGLMSSLIRNK
jgi:uncharacterized membrane protein YgcG